jgi:hypothetical protein
MSCCTGTARQDSGAVREKYLSGGKADVPQCRPPTHSMNFFEQKNSLRRETVDLSRFTEAGDYQATVKTN